MVVIFAVFLFHVKPAGVFGVILRFFGNFKPLKNICLPVFWLFHVKHRLFFRYYVIFLIVGLFLSVFVVFLAQYGLLLMVFAVFFLVSRETCRFHSLFLLFCGNFARYVAFFCFGWFIWGYFLVLNGFYYVFAFNGCTYLKF